MFQSTKSIGLANVAIIFATNNSIMEQGQAPELTEEELIAEEDKVLRSSLIVNFAAGPGAGKTTLCAGVFTELKLLGINCEIAPEYAKGIVWEGSLHKLKNQIYIFGKQHQAIFRLCGKVDVVLTDSPIFLSTIYDKRRDPLFRQYVLQEFDRFNNLNFYVRREKKYLPKGRTQTEEEAREVDDTVHNMLVSCGLKFEEVRGDRSSIAVIADKIVAALAAS